jgi:hypothetical protein
MSYLTMAVPPFETTDGTALANSTTLTDISTAPQKFIPAGQLEAGYEMAASTAVTQGTATAWPLEMYWRGVVRSIGPTGTIYGQGHIHVPSSLSAFTPRFIPEVAASRLVTIDTTTAKTITVGAQWGAASASNTITCKDLSVLILNAR